MGIARASNPVATPLQEQVVRMSPVESLRCFRIQGSFAVPSRPSPPLDGRKERTIYSFRVSKGECVTDRERDDLLQGTLDMLVLKALQLGTMHGWGITERLENGSKN